MYLYFRKLQDWRVNVKNVFVIQSLFLFLILTFPTSIKARDYDIQASDGEVYTIIVGENTNVDNFSIKRSNGEILQGVTEEERVLAAELYFAARLLWIVRTHYSPDTDIYDWVEGVRISGEDAFNKLISRQIATTVGNLSADIAVALSTAGIATTTKAATKATTKAALKEISSDAIWKIIAEEISPDTIWDINGEVANQLEERVLLDAYFVALATGAEALKYENLLRQTWQSTETQSGIISIDEINAAWEHFYKMGDYQLLTSDLMNEYLGVPDLSERLSDFFISFLPVIADLDTLESIEYSIQHLQEMHNLKKNSDTEIHQRALEEIVEGKKEARTTLEQASFFMPLQDQSPMPPKPVDPNPGENVANDPSLPNHSPQVSHQINRQNFTVGDAPKWRNLSSYFSDPDGDMLIYKANSSNDHIVVATIEDNSVKITPGEVGTTTVTVTAEDPGGLIAEQSFRVTVQAKLETIPSLPVCDRTPQVREEIMKRTRDNNCANVTEDELESIRRLSMLEEGIDTLKQGDFDELRGLEELVLKGNFLSTLPEDVFWYLRRSLKELNLENNQFTTLEEGTFEHLDSLTDLSLRGNQLTVLQEGVFDDLETLIELDLRDNQLTILSPRVFKNLFNLQELVFYPLLVCGYSLFSLMRASSVVKCQSTLLAV